MPYNANIPQATDQLSQSQGDLLNNFQAINTFVNVNHVDFPSGDQGKHKYVELPVQVASPPIAFPANEIALYSFLDPVTNVNQLYINNANGTQTPMTGSLKAATPGWSYLPSGLIMKWGFATSTGINPFTVTFPVAANIPVFATSCLNVQVTMFNAAGGPDANRFASVIDFNAVQFRVWTGIRTTGVTAAAQFWYFAIGS